MLDADGNDVLEQFFGQRSIEPFHHAIEPGAALMHPRTLRGSFYEEPGLVRIVRVMHGAMDIEAQFAEKNGGTDSNPT